MADFSKDVAQFKNFDYSSAEIKEISPQWPGCRVYKIGIKTIASSQEVPCTQFRLADHRVTGNVLELLVEYSSPGDPEIQALWQETSGKLFLVGGKIDPPVTAVSSENRLTFSLSKTNRALISLDLQSLGKKGELEIFARTPPVFAMEPPAPPVKVWDASDQVLMKIVLN